MTTTARQYPLRSTSEQTQRLNESVLFSAPISTERAPCTRSVRRYESPAFVILPNFDFPPLLYCDGVNPSQAASCRPFLKSCALPIQATRAQAVVGPTPYIIHKSRERPFWLPKFRGIYQPAYSSWVNHAERSWQALHDTITRNHQCRSM